MAGSLDNKVAIITGGGQGVGQGIAYAMASEGARIVLGGRTVSKMEATAAEIEQRGSHAAWVAGDVKDNAHLAELVDTAKARFGRIDIVVNNAQEVPLGPLNAVTDEAFDTGWRSGPLATLRMMKLAYPHLKETEGCIVNLASTAAKRWDMSNYGAYAAVKEAIVMLTRAAACEWGPDNIRANVIFPHAQSPALKAWMERNPAEAAAFQASIPMRRVGECEEDIGRFVAALCSDASRYVSGQCIAIDGGQANMA